MSSSSSLRGLAVIVGLGLSTLALSAQSNWDQRRNLYTRLEPGMTIPVRTNDSIEAGRADYRVYNGTVDQDVRGDNNRLAIPRGSSAELIVRAQRDGDLVLDLESVSVNGERYAVKTDAQQLDTKDHSLLGAIVGAIPGVDVRGRSVRVPRNTVMTFRLEQPIDMGVVDRGVTRDGFHYHDYYGRGRQ